MPPLNELEVAVGEVQTLPTHGKLHLGVSSTNHAGLKEMLISRKARHEQAFEAYKKRTGQLEVELEARTAHVARSFKQLMALNDAELKTMFEELADDFLLQMEMEVRAHTLSTSSPPHAPTCPLLTRTSLSLRRRSIRRGCASTRSSTGASRG